MCGELQQCHPSDSHRAPDEEPSEISHDKVLSRRKKKCSQSRPQGTCRQKLAGAPMVRQNSCGYLHGNITVEVESGEMPQRCSPNLKVAHQLVCHHSRGDPLIETSEVEKCSQSPDSPGEPSRRVWQKSHDLTMFPTVVVSNQSLSVPKGRKEYKLKHTTRAILILVDHSLYIPLNPP